MSSFATALEKIVQWGLVALLIFTPAAFGSVEGWSLTLMEWGIITLFLLFLLSRAWPGRESRHRSIRATGLEVPLAAFLLLALLQLTPMPLPWLRVISPGSWRMYEEVDVSRELRSSHPDWPPGSLSELAIDMTSQVDRPISVAPRKTLDRVVLLVSLTALFLLVSSWTDRRERVTFLIQCVTIVGSLVATQGLIQFLTWNGRIYWLRRVPPSSAFGPFVNHNHFAGYVGMIIPVAISLMFFLLDARTSSPSHVPGSGRPGSGDVGPRPGSEEGRWSKGVIALLATVILVTTLFLSLSRGGILSSCVSGLILFALVWRRITSKVMVWSIALGLPALAVVLIAWVGADAVAHQLGTYRDIGNEASFQMRAQIWRSLIRHQSEFLWVGSGLGTFEESFASFTPPGAGKRWDRAHNDYLQLLWETGTAGLLMFFAGAVIFVVRYWWPALRSRRRSLDLFRVGIAMALTSIAIHSAVDFSLQIGANGFLFALLAGVLVAVHRMADVDRPERVIRGGLADDRA